VKTLMSKMILDEMLRLGDASKGRFQILAEELPDNDAKLHGYIVSDRADGLAVRALVTYKGRLVRYGERRRDMDRAWTDLYRLLYEHLLDRPFHYPMEST